MCRAIARGVLLLGLVLGLPAAAGEEILPPEELPYYVKVMVPGDYGTEVYEMVAQVPRDLAELLIIEGYGTGPVGEEAVYYFLRDHVQQAVNELKIHPAWAGVLLITMSPEPPEKVPPPEEGPAGGDVGALYVRMYFNVYDCGAGLPGAACTKLGTILGYLNCPTAD